MSDLQKCVVLIPAFQPDFKLINLLENLKCHFNKIVLVNDGSTNCDEIFSEARKFADAFIEHEFNKGKGAAIKTGLHHILENYGNDISGVVTADADGQHKVEDIIKVAQAMLTYPNGLVLGVRSFSGKVPLRSRFGNFCTIIFFFIMTGIKVSDTQTGLRGIPKKLLRRASKLPGKRYEYEMTMLADSKRHEALPLEVPIETVYIADNQSSHFHPIKDAVRIYRSLLQFCISSVTAFVLDNLLFTVTLAILASTTDLLRRESICVAFCLARFISGNFQYFYNKFVVFRHKVRKRSYFQYWMLALAIALVSSLFTSLLAAIGDVRGLWITPIKIAVDTAMFFSSYSIQKKWIFKRKVS
jgi:glycosyltransferase involved in cell wall biosynthesis